MIVRYSAFLLLACSIASEGCAQTAADVLTTAAGRYKVTTKASLPTTTLPRSNDLKMVNGDLGKFAVEKCGLSFARKEAVQRCDVYVQRDPAELLTGYVILSQGKDVSIDSELMKTQGDKKMCVMSGPLSPEYGTKIVLGREFGARLPFAEWERGGPNDTMLSFGEQAMDNLSDNATLGMWYIRSKGGNLRIEQERWNYCYKDASVDVVFEPLVTLARVQ